MIGTVIWKSVKYNNRYPLIMDEDYMFLKDEIRER